jgi:hypothetical protein
MAIVELQDACFWAILTVPDLKCRLLSDTLEPHGWNLLQLITEHERQMVFETLSTSSTIKTPIQ